MFWSFDLPAMPLDTFRIIPERMLVLEQFFLIPASFGSSYTYNRFYGDILIVYLKNNGQIKHAQRLVKAQQTFNNFGEFSSYYLERKDSVFRSVRLRCN